MDKYYCVAKDKIIDSKNYHSCYLCVVGGCKTIKYIQETYGLDDFGFDHKYEPYHVILVNKKLRRDKLERILND